MQQQRETFKPLHHIPRYSKIFIESLFNPILLYIVTVGNTVMLACAGLFYFIEEDVNPKIDSLFDAIWWAYCTITTVGYGDLVPVTDAGRVIAIFCMILGVTFFVSYTAMLVSLLSRASTIDIEHDEKEIKEGIEQINRKITSIEKALQELKKQP